MKTKRKIVFFIALMSLFYCISLMQETYAKYVSSASAGTNLTIARWNIIVNNQDIQQNSNFSNRVTPVFSGTTNIKSGVLAPTSEGYFDIILDGTYTDTAFTYTIDIDQASTNTVDDLKISRYMVDGVEHAYNGNSITETIALNAVVKRREMRFYIKWDDDLATQTMSNAQDTVAANGVVAAFDIDVKAFIF